MHKIVISAGHYGLHPGVEKNGYNEYTECKKIVDSLEKRLKKNEDLEVIVIDGKLIDKVNAINSLKGLTLALEVHLGNVNNDTTSGTRSFYMIENENSKKLARYMLNSCVQVLDTEDKGVHVGWYKKISPEMIANGKAPGDWKPKIDLFISKVKNCPSVTVEPFYISSKDDCEDFIAGEAYDEVAEALELGILDFIDDCKTVEKE